MLSGLTASVRVMVTGLTFEPVCADSAAAAFVETFATTIGGTIDTLAQQYGMVGRGRVR